MKRWCSRREGCPAPLIHVLWIAILLPGGACSVTRTPAPAEPDQKPIFVSGRDGYDTYRIPALLTTGKGTLLAFCEGRKDSRRDHGNIDLLIRRSTDGGETWSRQEVVWDDGGNTCGNPCPVVDQETGTIWLLLTHNPGDEGLREIRLPGARGTRTVWVTSSEDDGKTWAPPREITATTKKPGWDWYATGPGVGIQLRQGPHRGRLVIPCDYSYPTSNPDEVVHQYEGPPIGFGSHVIYSDDHGKSWHLGGNIQPQANECQVAELTDGRILLNFRSYFGRNLRGRCLEQRRWHDLVGVAGRSPVDRAGLPGQPASLWLARGGRPQPSPLLQSRRHRAGPDDRTPQLRRGGILAGVAPLARRSVRLFEPGRPAGRFHRVSV